MKNSTILGLLLIAAVCISPPVAGASAVVGLTPLGVPSMTKLSDAAVCKALKSSNALEREAAAQEIGTRKASTCEADVRLLLTDLQPTVRLVASDTLLQLGDKSGIPVLQELLVGSSPSTALRAAGVLARAGDGAGVALAQSKLSSDNPITRWKALMALKMAADKNVALAALSIGLNDKTERVRVPAITYLGQRGDSDSVALLKPVALADPSPLTRQLAVRALAASSMNDALPVLIECLSDTDHAVRLVAAVQLASLTKANPSGIDPLQASKDAKAAEIAVAWKAWWQANQATYASGSRIPGVIHNPKVPALM